MRNLPWLIVVLSGCGLPVGVVPNDALPEVTATTLAPVVAMARVNLGRLLFFDPVLSGDRDVACATCHHPAFGYADGRALSVGVGGRGLGPSRVPSPSEPHITPRNSPTVLNTVFNGIAANGRTIDPAQAPMFWDSRAKSLEAQARGPLTSLAEMRGTHFTETTLLPEVVTRLSAIADYRARFEAAYASEGITETTLLGAIATFERTLVDSESSFDRGMLSAAAARGRQVFQRSGCGACHSGPMFSDYELHALGVPTLPGATVDVGAGGGRFRTPSLRNVTRTAPYMQNGALPSLDAVLEFYDQVDERLDPKLRGLRVPDRGDRADLEAFLEALSDGTFDTSVPGVPSGLAL